MAAIGATPQGSALHRCRCRINSVSALSVVSCASSPMADQLKVVSKPIKQWC